VAGGLTNRIIVATSTSSSATIGKGNLIGPAFPGQHYFSDSVLCNVELSVNAAESNFPTVGVRLPIASGVSIDNGSISGSDGGRMGKC
jgi:hypothetical protein